MMVRLLLRIQFIFPSRMSTSFHNEVNKMKNLYNVTIQRITLSEIKSILKFQNEQGRKLDFSDQHNYEKEKSPIRSAYYIYEENHLVSFVIVSYKKLKIISWCYESFKNFRPIMFFS